ncbi:hypothetical protein F2Q70_00039192 [Brassica cretica]|uniref:Uncharacterized protein n=1 Tax=Brassica cretica TaxID=69181 RepID=A0A8S9KBM3_BRACR|nr:hypothetical protein F2Q70_00039192 [Brassica cretica]
MPTLETPVSGTGVNLPPTVSGGDASTREKGKDAQTYDVEDSESERELDKEEPDGATKFYKIKEQRPKNKVLNPRKRAGTTKETPTRG